MTQRSRDPRQELADTIRSRFGTAPDEPSPGQLQQIINDVAPLLSPSRSITDKDWRDAVRKHVGSFGKYRTAAINNADLERLLKEILRGS